MSGRWLAGMLLLLAVVAAVPAAVAVEAARPAGAARESAFDDARRAHEQEQRRARLVQQRREHRFADYEYGVVRTVILALGLGVFVWGFWLREKPAGRASRVRLALLVLLGIVAYCSYYQFFQLLHAKGFRTTDNYHYYVGSKYFAEVGYYGLYECSLRALEERGRRSIDPSLTARRLSDMQRRPMSEILEAGAACPARFSPERWAEFTRDVGYFVEGWPETRWESVWDDHGYHPSPVWSFVGRAVAEPMPTQDAWRMRLLSRVDRWFVAAGLIAIAWGFGLEAAALAALIWGTGHLWRYAFVGDAFLRHLWWTSAVIGICLLRRGGYAWSGSLLAFASLLRIFPGALPLGFLLGAARRMWERRSLPHGASVFVAGGAVATLGLVALAALTNGRGLSAFVEFAHKISLFAALPAANKMGLGVLSQWLVGPGTLAASLFVLGMRIVFVWLFWRALAHARDWESAALGIALIPILTDPTNYYYSFAVLSVVLAVRRPRIGLWGVACALLWNLNGLINYRTYEEYAYASAIAVLFAFALVLEMARPAVESGAAQIETHDARGAAAT